MNVNPRIRIDPASLPHMWRRLKAIRLHFAGTETGAQAWFAKQTGIRPSNWNTWERGGERGSGQRIGIDAALKLVERWPVSLDYIYRGKTDSLDPSTRKSIRRHERALLKED
jgi:hypothetical protein